jgi:thiamine transport system substrate-binding protein
MISVPTSQYRGRAVVRVIALLVVSLLVPFVAFGAGTQETDEQAVAGAAPDQPTDELLVYSYDAFPEALETLIVEHFEIEYNVTATLERFQDTGAVYNQVWVERSNPQADVVIGLDNTYVGRALEGQLFQAYRPEGADRIREDIILDPEYRLTPFDWGHIVLNYDSEALPDPPSTWEELLDPRLRESIVLMNPATSSPGRNFLLLTIAEHGEDGYLDFWEQIRPNILTITAGWSEGYGLYTQGEAPIALSYETSPAYHIEYEDTTRYKNLILDGKGYGQVEVAGITSGAPNLANAKRLMDFILTNRFQQEIPLNQFMYPAVDGVALPAAFEQLEKADETVFIPVDRVDANFEQWLSDWQAVMQ